MYKKITYLITVTLILFAVTSNTFAQKEMRGINKLNLTEEQKTEFEEIKLAQQEKMIDLTSALKKEQLELKRLISDENSSTESLINVRNRMHDIMTQIGDNRLEGWLAVNKILDPEQQKMWKKAFPGSGYMQKAMREHRSNRNRH